MLYAVATTFLILEHETEGAWPDKGGRNKI